MPPHCCRAGGCGPAEGFWLLRLLLRWAERRSAPGLRPMVLLAAHKHCSNGDSGAGSEQSADVPPELQAAASLLSSWRWGLQAGDAALRTEQHPHCWPWGALRPQHTQGQAVHGYQVTLSSPAHVPSYRNST